MDLGSDYPFHVGETRVVDPRRLEQVAENRELHRVRRLAENLVSG